MKALIVVLVIFSMRMLSQPSEQRYDSIFVIVGHSDRSEDVAFMRDFNSALDNLTAWAAKGGDNSRWYR